MISVGRKIDISPRVTPFWLQALTLKDACVRSHLARIPRRTSGISPRRSRCSRPNLELGCALTQSRQNLTFCILFSRSPMPPREVQCNSASSHRSGPGASRRPASCQPDFLVPSPGCLHPPLPPSPLRLSPTPLTSPRAQTPRPHPRPRPPP